MTDGDHPWVSDTDHPNYAAGRRGTVGTAKPKPPCTATTLPHYTPTTSPRHHVTTYIAMRPPTPAVLTVFGKEPDLTREGGSIPICNWLEQTTGMNVMLLPVGACDDGAHSQNEKFDRKNYLNGIKVRKAKS